VTFTSLGFVLFFLALLGLRACMRHKPAEKWLLLVAGICFYLSWSVSCIVLVLFIALTDYHIGRKLGQTTSPSSRTRLLGISLLTNIGLLGIFKYTNFFIENVCLGLNSFGWNFPTPHLNIILPPAISYFTFASMSYVIDVYYERMTPSESARDYVLFVMFFPKLLSGPIMRAREFLPQLASRVQSSVEDIEAGVACFAVGAVKKLVIADQIAGHVNLIFGAPSQYDGFTLAQGLLGYAVQLYCDFSGYSDMAIGAARILGFRLPENFQMPFGATSITEFWRRWHITLSSWFRDYIFIPLEIATRNNPKPVLRVSVNMVLTMLLCGLWHGASWNFVIWGGIHGAALSVHRIWSVSSLSAFIGKGRISQNIWTLVSRALTLGVLLLAWVFFRAESFTGALNYLKGMLFWNGGVRLVSPQILAAVLAVLVAHLLPPKEGNFALELPQKSLITRVSAYSCLLGLLVFLAATDSAPFIYFQF
jgi:alginate O-acetyltransferase complex protein AlgI